MHLMSRTPVGRTDDFESTQMKKVRFIFDYADKKCCDILQAGDFFDKPRGYNLLYWISLLLEQYKEVSLYSVAGQHDMYLRTDAASNLRLLWALDGVTRLKKVELSKKVTVYGVDYGGEVPTPDTTGFNILVIHAPITVPRSEEYLNHIEYSNAKQFLKKHKKYDLILCGDIHKKFVLQLGDRRILNSGPLLRTTTAEHIMNHKPGFYVLDTVANKVKWVEIPHDASGDVLTVRHKKNKAIDVEVSEFISEVKKVKINEVDLTKKLRVLLKKGVISGNVANILSELMEN